MLMKILIITSILLAITSCAAVTEISSSTSTTVDAVTPDITLNEFIQKRYIAIRQDAANGGGENLDALADLLGKKNKQAFSELVKQDFDSIFTDITSPSDIIARIERLEKLKNS